MIPSLFILTDTYHFTTCCWATLPNLLTEVSRVPLFAPITVVKWDFNHVTSEPIRGETFQWP